MPKGALVPFMKSVVYATSPDRIGITPLMIGRMDAPSGDATQRRFHDARDGWVHLTEAEMPFGRLLKIDESATAGAFLASEGSAKRTGAIIDFDRGVVGAGHAPQLTDNEIPR